MLAYPYTKSLGVTVEREPGGGLILCSLEKAEEPRPRPEPASCIRWRSSTSEHMVTLSERRDPWRSPGFELAGRRAFEHVGRGPEEIDVLELYSCFPRRGARMQLRELGPPLHRHRIRPAA